MHRLGLVQKQAFSSRSPSVLSRGIALNRITITKSRRQTWENIWRSWGWGKKLTEKSNQPFAYLVRLPEAIYSAHLALLVRIGQDAHGGLLLRDAVDKVLPAVVGDVLAQFPQQTGGPLLLGFRVFVLLHMFQGRRRVDNIMQCMYAKIEKGKCSEWNFLLLMGHWICTFRMQSGRTDGCRSEVRVREKDAIGWPWGVRLECTLSAAVKVHPGRED